MPEKYRRKAKRGISWGQWVCEKTVEFVAYKVYFLSIVEPPFMNGEFEPKIRDMLSDVMWWFLQALVSESFSAQLWMQPVLRALKSQGAAPRGQDPCLVFNMKGKKLPPADFNTLMKDALQSAAKFAELHLGPAKTQEQSCSSQ
jgi:hypothetical protein